MMFVFKRLISKIKQRKIAGFDVETFGQKNNFYMASVVSDRGTFVFYEADKMIEYIMKNLKGYWIYATNLDFDFFALFKNKLRQYPNKPIFRGKLLGVKMWASNKDRNKRQNSVFFLDTMNYAPFSVETLGRIIKLEKHEKPSCLGRIPKTETERLELELYNIRDTEITYKFMVWFQSMILDMGGELEITVAKTSLTYWRRNYFNDEWFKPVGWINEFVRKAYYGGRTEAFVRGHVSDLNYYDINSLYPAMMLNRIPNPNTHKYKAHCSYDDLKKDGVIECVVECPKNLNKPFLPYRTNTKLIFPSGTFKGVWTIIELRKAVSLGYKIKEFGKGILYHSSEYYFRDYVLDLYAKRKNAKHEKNPIELVYKLLMNSLYGKFGQKCSGNEWIHISEMKNTDVHLIKEIINDEYFRITSKKESMFVHPIISAYITSYARIRLYEYIEKNDVYYCDTDSVFMKGCTDTSDKLGDMKHEGYITEGIIVKPKFYSIVMSGMIHRKLKGAYRIDAESFDKIISAEETEYKYTKFVKYKESIRRHLEVNEKIECSKTFDMEDNKREWLVSFNPDEMQNSNPKVIVYIPEMANKINEKTINALPDASAND